MIRNLIKLLNDSFIIKLSIIIVTVVLIFILINDTNNVYIPYSIFPKNIDVKIDNKKNKIKMLKEDFFYNNNYKLQPSWAGGKYKQETNNILTK